MSLANLTPGCWGPGHSSPHTRYSYGQSPNIITGEQFERPSHDLALPGALSLGRKLGMRLPDDEAITILAVEVEDVVTFSKVCTPAAAATIPRAAEAALRETRVTAL